MADNINNSIEINKKEFRKIGYQLIDQISNFIDSIGEKLVPTGKTPIELQQILGGGGLFNPSAIFRNSK